MQRRISVIIPNYNMSSTIGKCLEAALNSEYSNFEVIVVDDCSTDSSVEIISSYPCRLIRLDKHSGASAARNTGAKNSTGEILLFTDADCLLLSNTLSIINQVCTVLKPNYVMGGTYTKNPYDKSFFSLFQSLYVHYTETKETERPDYIAAHAMVMPKEVFDNSEGFPEIFMPIIEDVEFSHRLRKSGIRLIMCPDIQVQHIFNFSFWRSLKNAFRKTKYWCVYLLKNREALTDSGAASTELKSNVGSYAISLILTSVWFMTSSTTLLLLAVVVLTANLFVNRRLIRFLYNSCGITLFTATLLYYIFVYPVPVGAGSIAGAVKYIMEK